MFKRVNRKTFLILLLCITGFTAVYLYYVKKQRQEAIASYLPRPLVGDIYKMEAANAVFYLQVKEVKADAVYFYRSRLDAWAASDILLNQFDSSTVVPYGKKDLEEIKNGRWDDEPHDHTSLIDISRK